MSAGLQTVPILMCADESYARYLPTALLSLDRHCGPDTRYEVSVMRTQPYARGVQEPLDGAARLLRHTDVRFLDIADRFARLPITIPYISHATYYRFLAAETLPEYDRCLYLDVDILACDELTALFNTPMDGCYIAGVPDAQLNRTLAYPRSIGIGRGEPYVNAGVLLLDLAAFRARQMSHTLFTLARKPYPLQDQDVMNVACRGRILRLPYRYNVIASPCRSEEPARVYSKEELAEAAARPAILHYMTDQKPWNCVGSFTDAWWEESRENPFYRQLLDDYPGAVSRRMQRQIDELKRSRSYRIGYAVTLPARALRRRLRGL